jgi:hypothetical protein
MECLIMDASIVVHLFGTVNGYGLLDAIPLLPTTMLQGWQSTHSSV